MDRIRRAITSRWVDEDEQQNLHLPSVLRNDSMGEKEAKSRRLKLFHGWRPPESILRKCIHLSSPTGVLSCLMSSEWNVVRLATVDDWSLVSNVVGNDTHDYCAAPFSQHQDDPSCHPSIARQTWYHLASNYY